MAQVYNCGGRFLRPAHLYRHHAAVCGISRSPEFYAGEECAALADSHLDQRDSLLCSACSGMEDRGQHTQGQIFLL